jgi:hypothetical protein
MGRAKVSESPAAVSLVTTLNSSGIKSGAKSRPGADEDDAESVDSMAMEVDEPDSEFGSDSAHPRLAKKSATAKGKKTAEPTVAKRKAAVSRRKDAVSMVTPEHTYHTYGGQE